MTARGISRLNISIVFILIINLIIVFSSSSKIITNEERLITINNSNLLNKRIENIPSEDLDNLLDFLTSNIENNFQIKELLAKH